MLDFNINIPTPVPFPLNNRQNNTMDLITQNVWKLKIQNVIILTNLLYFLGLSLLFFLFLKNYGFCFRSNYSQFITPHSFILFSLLAWHLSSVYQHFLLLLISEHSHSCKLQFWKCSDHLSEHIGIWQSQVMFIE